MEVYKMDDWKIRVQYISKYEVLMDKTEKQARKIFDDLKSKAHEDQIEWCELIHAPIDAEEIIVEDFESKLLNVLGYKLIV